MKLFIFILLSFCFLNSGLVYASDLNLDSNQEQAHMLEQAQKSVWKIRDSLGEATGFFISPNEFVTNFHVVVDILKNNSNDFTLSQKDIHKTLKIKRPKHLSPHFDLAVLEIEGEVSDYLNLAKKDPQLKENISLIGYIEGKFKIINKTYDISYENEFEYMYAVKDVDYAGASGAPVLNKKGEVVGVNYSSNRNYMFAIKIIHLKNLLKQDSPFFENPKDHFEHSMKELELLAESGDMIAQFRLGILYKTGQGVEKDFDEAARWYRKAAEQGYAPAQFQLGVMYVKGQGVEEDLKEAVIWYKKAAEQGFAEAQFNLGIFYEKGWGVKADLEEAIRWLRKAAEQGHAEAQNILGTMYEEGLGMEQDLKEAARWFRKSAEQEFAEAQFRLGILYLNERGVKADLEEAARWFRKSAEQEFAPAQFSVGLLYANGLSVGKDFKEAARWYKKAAEQGYAPAQFNLGGMYATGQGVEADLKEAAYWYIQAAEQGYVPALEMLEKNPELLHLE